MLARAVALGDFLVPLESFLSTRGNELGMIEDLEGALFWLSSVKVGTHTHVTYCVSAALRQLFVVMLQVRFVKTPFAMSK